MSDVFQAPTSPTSTTNLPHRRSYYVVLLLGLAFGLERLSHYGLLSILPIWFLTVYQGDHVELATIRLVAKLALPAATLVSGVVALWYGPSRVLVVGTSVLVAAYLCFTLVHVLPPWLPMLLMGVGGGLFKPALYAIVAAQFRDRLSSLRIAALSGMGVFVFFGSAGGPMAVAALLEVDGWTPVFLLCAASATTALCLSAWATRFASPDHNAPPTPVFSTRQALAALAVLPLHWLFGALVSLAEAVVNTRYPLPDWALFVSLAVVGVGGVFLLAVAVLSHHLEVQLAELPLIGLCLLVTSVIAGLALAPVASPHAAFGTTLYMLLALPGGFVTTLALSRLTREWPLETLPLVLALWITIGGAGGVVAGSLSALLTPEAALGLVCATSALTGLYLLARGAPMYPRREETA